MRTMDDTKRFVIDIDEPLHRKLKILAGIKRVRIRKLTNKAVEMYLEKEYEPAISKVLRETK